MEYNEITAGKMRGLIKTEESKELNEILEIILNRAKLGETNTYLSDRTLSHSTKKELINRGFDVQVGGRYNEISTYISW